MINLEEWTEAATTAEIDGGTVVVFPCLEELTIEECEALRIAPTHFPFLKKMSFIGMKSGVPIANICSGVTTTLTSLDIIRVSELISLPKELLQNNRNLSSLKIWNCEMLTYIVSPPDDDDDDDDDVGLQNLVSLQELSIWSCPKLSSIPNIHGLTSLRTLKIQNCDGISNLPIGLGSCTSLEDLRVTDCRNLICVAEEDLRELKSLSWLVIMRCGKLKGVVGGFEGFLHCLTRLEYLKIGGFWEELESFPFNLNINQQQHLKILSLYGWPKLKSLPDLTAQHLTAQHLTALRDLYIIEFDGLEALPDWLGNLSSLQVLDIMFCKNVKYLPSVESMRRLTNLRSLDISGCPLLKERCTKHSGPEWSKISHIPQIQIDRVTIQDFLTASSSSSS